MSEDNQISKISNFAPAETMARSPIGLEEDLSFPNIPPFPDIPTAPLLRISLRKLLDGDQAEEQRLWEACVALGFFYLDLRTGASDSQHSTFIDGDTLLKNAAEIFTVAETLFDLAKDEKLKYDAAARGSYYAGYTGIESSSTTDPPTPAPPARNLFFNIRKDDLSGTQPTPWQLPACLPPATIASFSTHSRAVIDLILSLLNTRLALPPGTLASLHRPAHPSGDQIRLIRGTPPPPGTPVGGHTDYGSVTVLFNQLGGLQVRLPAEMEPAHSATGSDGHFVPADSGDWAYVRPLRHHAIINLGDSLVKFSAGAVRSNIHRVVAPPGEQGEVRVAGQQGGVVPRPRYSIVYFARPELDVVLKPLGDLSEVIRTRVTDQNRNGISTTDVLKRMFSGADGPRGKAGLKGWAIGFA